MGSGAKIALVALLILMVVAVAKFVQTNSENPGAEANGKKDQRAVTAGPAAGKAAPQNPRPVISSRVVTPPAASQEKVASAPRSAPAESKSASPSASPSAPPAAPQPRVFLSGQDAPVAGSVPPAPPAPPAAPKASERPVENTKVEGAIVAKGAESAPSTVNRDIGRSLTGQGATGNTGTATARTDTAPGARLPDAAPVTPGSAAVLPAPGTFPASHVVANGESYWKIAEKFYGTGNGKYFKAISEANGNVKLISGKTIKIPAPPSSAAQAPLTGTSPAVAVAPVAPKPPRASTTTAPVESDAEFEYVVQKGDTVFGIARKYHRKAREIEVANNLQFQVLREGSKIHIPKK